MLAAYTVEFLGTFLFLSVVLSTSSPFLIAAALLAVIWMGGAISGGYFNPAITLMMFLKGAVSGKDGVIYAVAQFLGGVVALGIYRMFLSAGSN